MLLAVLAVLAAAGPAPFTLDQVMSAPFPTGLVAAQGHARVAWVMNARGTRNVWVAEGPAYRGRALTGFAEDDGEEISGLAFTADAQAVVFVRGGGPNRAGEIPNPWSRTEPRERAVHVVTLAGAARRLAEGHSPLPHPRESRIVFVEKNQVYTLELAEGAKPERLFAARGGLGSLRFSADGASLAFVSDRGDHAFVGVYDAATK
jgi:Tol biopolymer transport system component